VKEIFISVNIKKDEITILVMDNGIGCNKLIKGNGLKGIEDRLKLIDGTVEFITSKQEGFMSKISINK
jgi:signal transduction histidine kinase